MPVQARMYMKTRGVSKIRRIPAKMHLAEFMLLSSSLCNEAERKKSTSKMKVYPRMLLKTHVEKMLFLAYARMFMKAKDLNLICQNVDENK